MKITPMEADYGRNDALFTKYSGIRYSPNTTKIRTFVAHA